MMHWQTKDAICHLMGIRKIGRICALQASVSGELADERIEVASAKDVGFLHLRIKGIATHAEGFLIDEEGEGRVVVLYSWHVVKESDAFYISQCCAIFDGYLLSSGNGRIYLTEVQKTIG